MTLINHVGSAELKTFYSKQLLDRLIPALEHAKREFPYTLWHRIRRLRYVKLWSTETRIYSAYAKAWVVIVGPCDKIRRKPIDKTPRLPQSIQYPPGMEPKVTARWVWEDEKTTFGVPSIRCGGD